MKKVLEDVNLETICIGPDGRQVTFEFSDMAQRKKCANLVCGSTYLFRYDNDFTDADEGLPCYLGEVGLEELAGTELQERVRVLGYGFGVDLIPWRPDAKTRTVRIPSVEHAFAVHLEGEIVVDVVCAQVDFARE